MSEFDLERPDIEMFFSRNTRRDMNGYAYVHELFNAYLLWRKVNKLGKSKVTMASFARGAPKKFPRKLMNRHRLGENPARAVIGLTLRLKH